MCGGGGGAPTPFPLAGSVTIYAKTTVHCSPDFLHGIRISKEEHAVLLSLELCPAPLLPNLTARRKLREREGR